jgi:hypothetical protein
MSHKDKHHLLLRRLLNRKATIFTRVKAKRPSPGSERERRTLFLRALYAH